MRVIGCDCYRSGVMDVFSVRIVDPHEFLNVGFLLGKCEVEDSEIVFVCLTRNTSTRRSSTSLFSSIRASWVRQRVKFTKVAESCHSSHFEDGACSWEKDAEEGSIGPKSN